MKQLEQKIDRLTEALIFTLQIQEGIELVPILGDGMEKDNREAIKVWVAESLTAMEEGTGKAMLPVLQDKLQANLEPYFC